MSKPRSRTGPALITAIVAIAATLSVNAIASGSGTNSLIEAGA